MWISIILFYYCTNDVTNSNWNINVQIYFNLRSLLIIRIISFTFNSKGINFIWFCILNALQNVRKILMNSLKSQFYEMIIYLLILRKIKNIQLSVKKKIFKESFEVN